MPMLVLLAVGCLCLALPLLTWSVLLGGDPTRKRTVENLKRGLPSLQDQPMALPEAPKAKRARPTGLAALASRLAPGGSVLRIERLLARAGHPAEWPLERVLSAKLVLAAFVGAMGFLYALNVQGGMPKLLAIGATVLAFFVPELLIQSRGQERAQKIQLELADTLDQLTIAVEAGLGFDSALARAAKNGKGPLSEELTRTMQDIQVGRSRRQAYEALADRTGVADLRRFIRSIVQAETFGISVAGVLRTQAAEMRLKRRQRAEEKAMQIPVKVLFPLIVCILPTLFIVLLGPAVIDIMHTFSH